MEHIISIIVLLVFGIWFIRKGKYSWTIDQRWRYAAYFAGFLYFVQIIKVPIRLYLGNFDHTKDLPLELCNLLPLFMLISLLARSRFLLSIFFFWILAGTAQANVTPSLREVLPHYEAFRYWLIHMGLPILAVFTFYALGITYKFTDIVRSALGMNVLAAIMYPVNLMLGSNYIYLLGKPPSPTLYDVLGPWPWYILTLEFMLLICFSIVLIPFRLYLKYRGHKHVKV